MRSITPYFYPCVILLIGLLISQIIFSLIVFQSNQSLDVHLGILRDSGYLTVPNETIRKTLHDLAPAVYGGLFFTLTTGSGIIWATFTLMLVWMSLPHSKRLWLIFLGVWAVFLAMANLRGLYLPVTVALVLIPAGVGCAAYAWMDKTRIQDYAKMILSHGVCLILVGLSWAPHLNHDTFISIRDYLLLSNDWGRKINTFYYTYTMYPAEVFKSTKQKLLKSCALEIDDPRVYSIIEEKMRGLDYLPVKKTAFADIYAVCTNHRLILFNGQKKILDTPLQTFLSDPEKTLSDFSKRTDVNWFFRKMTLFSLCIAFPITIYIMVHGVMMSGLFWMRSFTWRFAISSLVCVMAGVLMTFPLDHASATPVNPSEMMRRLESPDWKDRTIALKTIADGQVKMDFWFDHVQYHHFVHIPEKYWFAKALSLSDHPRANAVLDQYLNDPDINVVCMALYSVGKRGHGDFQAKIMDLIRSNPHWYVQWYAYHALRRLGWIQPKSE